MEGWKEQRKEGWKEQRKEGKNGGRDGGAQQRKKENSSFLSSDTSTWPTELSWKYSVKLL